MGNVRVGAPVAAGGVPPGGRRSVKVIQIANSPCVLVENVPADLGFSADEAVNAARAFAGRLRRLTYELADRQRDLGGDPFREDGGVRDELLRLEPAAARAVLRDLKQIGAPLRNKLSAKVTAVLRPNSPDPPALTFVQNPLGPVVRWELMYETDESHQPSAVEWQRFWGFRAPISHWLYFNRTPRIAVRHGLLSAISDDLVHARREVGWLDDRLRSCAPWLRHQRLATALCEQARAALRRERGDAPAEDWWAGRGRDDDGWLSRFLDDHYKADRDGWVMDALFDILNRAPQELIHFACHCEPGCGSEFLSRLVMHLAGERVPLDVSLITRGGLEPGYDDPGPLVFLNACGSAEQNATFEPPGFPSTWIAQRGALAVVATLCPIPDAFGHAFALEFYDNLLRAPGRQSLAEALLKTRQHFMSEYGNPLGLAYVLYATEDAHVAADPPAAGGAA